MRTTNLSAVAIALAISALLFPTCKKYAETFDGPTIEINQPFPLNGASITRIVDIDVDARADTGRVIDRVEFYVDGVLLADKTDFEAPFSCQWTATDKFGEVRKIEAVAYDDLEKSAKASVEVRVWNAIKKTSMPTSRYCFTVETVNDIIYVIEGFVNGGSNKVVEAYNPLTDTWTTKKSPNKGHSCHSSCVIDGKIYVFGGDEGMNWIADSERYDPATDTWTNIAPIPKDTGVAIGLMGCVAYKGKAYLFGGLSTKPDSVRVGIYDPATDSWDIGAIKTGFSPSAAVIGEKIYVFGGCATQSIGQCNMPSDKMEEYDPVTGIFTPKASMLYSRSGHANFVFNGKIYCLGGAPNDTNTEIEVYNPATDTWTELPSISEGLINFGCAVAHGKVYIIGNSVYEFTPE